MAGQISVILVTSVKLFGLFCAIKWIKLLNLTIWQNLDIHTIGW